MEEVSGVTEQESRSNSREVQTERRQRRDLRKKVRIETQEVEVENLTPAVEETVAKQVENVQKINKFNRLQPKKYLLKQLLR